MTSYRPGWCDLDRNLAEILNLVLISFSVSRGGGSVASSSVFIPGELVPRLSKYRPTTSSPSSPAGLFSSSPNGFTSSEGLVTSSSSSSLEALFNKNINLRIHESLCNSQPSSQTRKETLRSHDGTTMKTSLKNRLRAAFIPSHPVK